MKKNLLPNSLGVLRKKMTEAYRMDEAACLNHLLPLAKLPESSLKSVSENASIFVEKARKLYKKQDKVQALLQEYNLSTNEGIALMCLAEALLRVPDKAVMDKLIGDKLSTSQWKNHLNRKNSLFLNATTWSLFLTGKIYEHSHLAENYFLNKLKQTASRLGMTVMRPLILQMVKMVGKQFVLGENIQSALKRAEELEKKGYRFSYDRLGEAARTKKEAENYFASYSHAISAIAKTAKTNNPIENPGISIKLSALHPRYEYLKYEQLIEELSPLLLMLAQLAKTHEIQLTVDAEEADRLDVSLDIFEKVYLDPSLAGWEGLGLAVQAYQKRAWYVIEWLAELAKQGGKRIMVRLVKGAYWDVEVKSSQIQGLNNYAVFTRKNSTDVSFLACANRLLAEPNCFYAQFATHNAHSIAYILELAKQSALQHFEFQCLYGMGLSLYDGLVHDYACRIYAPVGSYQDLLGYLTRRLLENGANSSFINHLTNTDIPVEKIIVDPVKRIESLTDKPHPLIPLPSHLYEKWLNSQGIDFSNCQEFTDLKAQMQLSKQEVYQAMPLIQGRPIQEGPLISVYSPADTSCIIGTVSNTTNQQMEAALSASEVGKKKWASTSIENRALILEKAADLFQSEMPAFMHLLVKEAGRCLPDALSEVREAIDFCRYYAHQARHSLKPQHLPSPTGETNQLTLHPRGSIACISPWNFPLSIFIGQISAALAAGNAVIAKPAEQTPLIGFKAVKTLHQAGVPFETLQFLPGEGETGARLVSDQRIEGVMLTGSLQTAKKIERVLAKREGPPIFLIAETGGQNAMIMDSSALIEQAVVDICQSAFNSAGQRCSALRVLFVQEEIAERFFNILKGYMQELTIGSPDLLTTDIGPVINQDALEMLRNHFQHMSKSAKLIAKVPLDTSLKGHYFAPCVFELSSIRLLKQEIFGPILHIIRYQEHTLRDVIKDIAGTGYGLTFGVHSRVGATIRSLIQELPIGNFYINRNMIGAVVGVQPFGGEGLSGTGPKAGGPYILTRLSVERAISTNTAAFGGNVRLLSLLEDD